VPTFLRSTSGRIVYSEGYERAIITGRHQLGLESTFVLGSLIILCSLPLFANTDDVGTNLFKLGWLVFFLWIVLSYCRDFYLYYYFSKENFLEALDAIPRRDDDPMHDDDAIVIDLIQVDSSGQSVEIDA